MTQQNANPANIVLLESMAAGRDNLQQALQAEGYQCHSVRCFEQIDDYLDADSIDLLIITTEACLCNQVKMAREALDCYLPILVICNQIDDELLDRFADASIDAFITRPINLRLLLIKIQTSLKIRRLHQQQSAQHQQLLDYWQLIETEQAVAARIFETVLNSRFLQTEVVQAVLSPMALFNGDLLLVAKTPDNHLHLLLGDFTGHGLAASIAATPTADIFYGMTQKGFAIAEIVSEINKKLYKILPANMFLATTVLALKPDSNTLRLIACGLPEHFLFNSRENCWTSLHSQNIPLGIDEAFEFNAQTINLIGDECLYLLTDGVFEAENQQGELFGSERVIAALSQPNVSEFDTLQTRLSEFTQGLTQKDDLTFVKLYCDVKNLPWAECDQTRVSKPQEALSWKSLLEFDIDTLRTVNPVPVMFNALMDIQGLQEHRQTIFMVISELFANALDHGVLGLDSAIKNTPDGFIRFYELKEQGLQRCPAGKIRLLLQHQPTEQGGRLTIKVKDSGKGFNWSKLQLQALDDNQGYSGRGLKLVASLCSSLTYSGRGNQVTAVFDWCR